MTVTDPIADMLTRVRNAITVRQRSVVMPSSRMKEAVARVLREEGFVHRYDVIRDGKFPALRINLKYAEGREPVLRGLKRVSTPGCRVYTKKKDIPWVKSGVGIVILSTPQGVMSGRQARERGLGGEILCEAW